MVSNKWAALRRGGGAGGAAAEAAAAAAGWHDPAPYPFVLAGATPSLGVGDLIHGCHVIHHSLDSHVLSCLHSYDVGLSRCCLPRRSRHLNPRLLS